MLGLFRSKIILALLMLAAVLLVGVVGYRFISGLTWIDALYMTIITVTTVGFKEVQPMDTEARIFTIFLIISSVFIFAFAISMITEYLMSRNSLKVLKQKK